MQQLQYLFMPTLDEQEQHTAAAGEIIQQWPSRSRRVAQQIIEQYGPPQEATDWRLIWHGNRPWKRTVVHRKGVPHNFPKQHLDFLEQTIEYRVPTEKVGALARFDGSILIDRTWGEMSACCDSEGMNILLLNLAHDIVLGEKTVEEARSACARLRTAMSMHWPQPYVEELRFFNHSSPSNRETFTPDPDRSVGMLAR